MFGAANTPSNESRTINIELRSPISFCVPNHFVPNNGIEQKRSLAIMLVMSFTIFNVFIRCPPFRLFPSSRNPMPEVYVHYPFLAAAPKFSVTGVAPSLYNLFPFDNMGHEVVHSVRGENALENLYKAETSMFNCMTL